MLLMPAISSYPDAINYLYSLERFGIRMGLKRIKTLLKLLKGPHKKFPIIHIAGTNGKGSTSAIIASILHEAGYKVGLYTSPHLVRFNERIKINGEEISDERIEELVSKIKEKIESSPSSVKSILASPTFFEFTTTLAFLYFAERMVDIAVVEAGLGGRLDATNVCAPIVSIITNIAREHEDILGKGIENIAAEKAGIIKRGGVLVTASRDKRALQVFQDTCSKREAKIYQLGMDFKIRRSRGGFSFEGMKWHLKNLRLNLAGRFQYVNASLSLFGLEIIDGNRFKITEGAVKKGLENVRLRGRLDVISRRPLVILDCAHNPSGAKILRDSILKEFNYKRLILVVGIMADKDIKGFFSYLAPAADMVILTVPHTPRAANIDILLPAAKSFAKNIIVSKDVKKAYSMAKSMTGGDDLVCVTGSFHTVGEVMNICQQE